MGAKNTSLQEILLKISLKFAVGAIIFILIGVLIYHLLIITGMIPYEATWGGRLENKAQMYRFETFSIAINFLILLVVCIKGGILNINGSPRLIKIMLYAFAILFALNTIGNLFSENIWETLIFTPMTLVLAILFARLAID